MKKFMFMLIFLSVICFAGEYKTVITTKRHTHKEVLHYLEKYELDELDATSISYIYVSPMRDKCFAPIILPKYATLLSLFTPSQYKTNYGMDGFGTNAIDNDELHDLYMAVYEKDIEKGKKIFLNIFNRLNKYNCKIKYYGKDCEGRNTLYIYKVGFADRGVVVYYPDDFSSLIKGKADFLKMVSKDPTRVGYREFLRRFVELMKDYNKHIKVIKATENNEDIIVLKFQDFKGE